MYCNEALLSSTMESLRSYGFQNVDSIAWYKFNQNAEGTNNFVYAFEWLVLGWRGGKAGLPWNLDQNPLRRHNLLYGPTQRQFHKNTRGEIINHYQKPAYLAYNLCTNM